MRIIPYQIKSHVHLRNKMEGTYRVNDVIQAKLRTVTKFENLVRDVAHLSHWNHRISVFFRGQTKEYFLKK